MDDESYKSVFEPVSGECLISRRELTLAQIIEHVMGWYRPDAIVLQVRMGIIAVSCFPEPVPVRR